MKKRAQWDDHLERAARLLRSARHAIALTGAGVSTPSGIPDFRTPGKGLWESSDPLSVASIFTFRQSPEVFYDWVRPMADLMLHAEPNPAHVALAELEDAGVLKAVITQNIDGLHQRAGSRQVLEVHGHMRTATCLTCFRSWQADGFWSDIVRGDVPHCLACGGVVKPDVILMGEQLPVMVVTEAMEHARRADVMLVAGSSLMVVPAARLPALVSAGGGDVIIINQQPTYADSFAAAVFHANVAEILPRLAEACVEEHP